MMAGEDRRRVISETVDRIRNRAANQEMTPEILSGIKDDLIGLAARRDLFSLEDFPPPVRR